MSSINSDPSPFERSLTLWDVSNDDPLKEAIPVSQLSKDLLNIPPHIPAEELDGKSFVIVALKEFESTFAQQDHAYFAGCIFEDGEKFTTVLGGMVVIETLDALLAAGNKSPIRVTLIVNKQGKYGRYYTIE